MKYQPAKSFVAMLALVLGLLCTPSASSQTFKLVKTKGGAGLVAVASGGTSVWALSNTGGHPYVLKGKQFVLANNVSLSQIAAGGGSALQADSVWGLDTVGHIYTAVKSGTTWSFPQVSGALDFVTVGPGYQDSCHPYEVWGLHAASIYRYNFCGKNFDFVPGSLATVAVGGGGVWGINGNTAIFRFNFSTLQFDEVPPGSLMQITVGPNGVWGLNGNYQVFQFDENVQSFFQLPGTLVQVQAGGNGVWAINILSEIFRLDPSTSTFVQIPGSLTRISVGSGAGVWGISGGKQAYNFSMP